MLPTLEAAAKRYRHAQEAALNAKDDLRRAALEEIRAGAPEADVARRAGVDRMTLRRWQGKR